VPDKEKTTQRPPFIKRPLAWWVAAFAVIALGYADLARGGDTLAPILLIAGYCVLVPIAILR
jgi:hypothetical protein